MPWILRSYEKSQTALVSCCLGNLSHLSIRNPKPQNASDRRLVAILGDFHRLRHLESSHWKVHSWVRFDSFTRVQTISQNDWFTISTALTGTHGWGYLDFNEHNYLKIYTPKIALQNRVFLWSEFLFQTLAATHIGNLAGVQKPSQVYSAVACYGSQFGRQRDHQTHRHLQSIR